MELGPVLIYDDGWFYTVPFSKGDSSPLPLGYRCWDIEFRWRAVPDDLKPNAWLNVYMPLEWIFPGPGYKQDGSGVIYADVETAYRDPEYEQKELHFLKALNYAQQQGISVALGVGGGVHLREAAAPYEKVEDALKRYPCVKALFLDEVGCGRLTEVDQEHIQIFTGLARKYGRKVLWCVYLWRDLILWNYLMADSRWLTFLSDNSDVIVPVYKNVEPFDNMLNWADCVGMWLSGLVKNWGFNFDSWYWPNYYAVSQGSSRGPFWSSYYLHKPRNEPNLTACPPYLVKDTMILAALTGATYLMNERQSPFSCFKEGGGSLREVLNKTFRLITRKKLCLGRESVAALVKVAATNPPYEELFTNGYSHFWGSTSAFGGAKNKGPNLLWKAVFSIPDGGLDIVPNEGRHYIVPVIPDRSPPNIPPHRFARVLRPEDVKNKEVLLKVLAEQYPQRFSASDPNVLIFDAGDVVYLTDSREENRTTLKFILKSSVRDDYDATILAEDATTVEVDMVTERLPNEGWQKKFILFAGTSILLIRRRE